MYSRRNLCESRQPHDFQLKLTAAFAAERLEQARRSAPHRAEAWHTPTAPHRAAIGLRQCRGAARPTAQHQGPAGCPAVGPFHNQSY
jgi:hypothetical protein